MKVGLVIYGSLATASGGYLYDRMLVQHLRSCGDQVDVISLRRPAYIHGLMRGPSPGISSSCDVLLQDELCHPSLIRFNRSAHLQPIVSIVHNLRCEGPRPKRLFYRIFESQYLRGVDAFIFNSRTTRASVTRLAGAERPQLVAVPGGDRLGEVKDGAARARATKPGPLRLVFLANVIRGKGLEVLLRALRMLDPAWYCLDVLGSCDVEPAHAGRMQRLALRLGLPVRFHGNVEGTALIEMLRDSHVVVVPSYYEGFGIAYLEGMAQGLVAIGTTSGAAPEIIEDGVEGFLVGPGDAKALAERISTLALDRGLLARMATDALLRYKSSPTWKMSMQGIRQFLLTLVNPTPRSNTKTQGEQA